MFRFMRRPAIYLAILAITAFFTFGYRLPVLADDQQLYAKSPVLVVTGTSVVNVAPDQAQLDLAVVTIGSTAAQVQEENFQTINKVIAALTAAGISESDIETSGFNAWPQYSYPEGNDNTPPKIVGYRIENQISIRMDNLKEVGKIMDIAIKAGANQVQGITYSQRNSTQAQADVCAKACLNAMTKANSMAKALGVKLGDILSISEEPSGLVPVPVFTRASSAIADSGVQLQPGSIKVQATVTITYQIIN